MLFSIIEPQPQLLLFLFKLSCTEKLSPLFSSLKNESLIEVLDQNLDQFSELDQQNFISLWLIFTKLEMNLILQCQHSKMLEEY